MPSPLLSERRIAAVVLAGAIVVFLVLALAVPGFYPSFDEQKYLGIGYNLLAGRGPTTVFGDPFIVHSPLWSAVLAAPDVTLGIDPWAWGRLLGAISGAAVVGLGGALGWRVRPAVGALTAAGILAIPYLHDLARTARLDAPAAALALLYVVIGLEAVRRGSTRWAFAAGITFAFAFLVKEVALPFAPIPILAGILWRRPWVVLARVGAWILMPAALGVSWWFAMYAAMAHRVYRLDSPLWTLIPISVAIIVAIVVGIGAGRLARSPSGRRLAARVDAGTPAVWRRHGRTIAGWGLALGWFAVLTIVFARTARLKGGPLLDLPQFRSYAAIWLSPFRTVAVFGALGVALAVVAFVRERDDDRRRAIADLLLATLCGAPLVLLVIAVGEPPRNYLAQIAILVAIAAVGVVWAVERLVAIRPSLLLVPIGALIGTVGGVVAANLIGTSWTARAAIGGLIVGGAAGAIPWLVERSGSFQRYPPRAIALATTLVVALLVASGTLAVHVHRTRPDAGGRGVAVTAVSHWLQDNIPPGSKVAFPSFLGYEMALALRGRGEPVQVRARIAVADPSAPEGLVAAGEAPADDWIAVDTAPRNVNEYQAFRAAWLEHQLGTERVQYWVYTTGLSTAAGTIIPALASSTGIEQVYHRTFPVPGHDPIDSYVFKIDPARVAFDTSRLYMAPDALDRLVSRLEHATVPPTAVARTLLDRVVPTATTALADAALARLRTLAGR